MAQITFGGNAAHTVGDLPAVGTQAPAFALTDKDLNTKNLSDYQGTRVVLNIFPSVGTGVCAASARKFNQEASKLENTRVLCISKDLPFAQSQFCAAEGIDNVEMLSDYKSGSFGQTYGLTMADTPFEGLLSRVVMVLDEDGKILHTEQVPEIGQEPDYEAALSVL